MKMLPSWAFCKKALRFIFFAGVLLVTAVTLAASWLAFQGRREWNQTKNDLLARGEKLSVIELAPPSIPDQLNFFADPVWAEIVNQRVSQPDGTFRNETAVPTDRQQFALLKQKPTREEAAFLQRNYPAFSKLSYTDPRITIGLRARALVARGTESGVKEQFPAFTLALLAPLSPFLVHIEELSERPGSRFSLDYQAGFSANISHMTSMIALMQAFSLRATANVRVQDGTAAFPDCLILIRLSRATANEPFLISHLVRLSLAGAVLGVIDEGIKSHVWTDAQLATFQQMLSKDDLAASLALSLRGERGAFNQMLEALHRKDTPAYKVIANSMNPERPEAPMPWWDKVIWQAGTFNYMTILAAGDQAFHNRIIQQCVDHLDAVQTNGFSPSIDKLLEPPRGLLRYRHVLSTLTFPTLKDAFKRTAYIQNSAAQTLLACALERYRLKNGVYPPSLDELVPNFLPSLPMDIVTLKPLGYERIAPDKFRLWSVGWDNKDDDGQPANRQLDDGDWPWAETLTRSSPAKGGPSR